MSNKVTMKVPEWQRDAINKIQEIAFPDCDQSETLGKVLSNYGALLVVQRTDGLVTYPQREEVDVELLEENTELKDYWASIGAEGEKEVLTKQLELSQEHFEGEE